MKEKERRPSLLPKGQNTAKYTQTLWEQHINKHKFTTVFTIKALHEIIIHFATHSPRHPHEIQLDKEILYLLIILKLKVNRTQHT